MHLHIVSIPAANVAEDAPLALERGGIFTMFEGEGDIITRAPVTLLDDMPDPVTWAAELGAGIAAQVRTGLRTNDPVLVLGGNCNALVGVLAGSVSSGSTRMETSTRQKRRSPGDWAGCPLRCRQDSHIPSGAQQQD